MGDAGVLKATAQLNFAHRDHAAALGQTQAFGRRAAVSTHQTAGTELDAAKPAHHQHHHLIEALAIDGSQNRSAGGTAGLAVVVEAIALTDAPGPAVVAGGSVALASDKAQGLIFISNRRGLRDKAALAPFLGKGVRGGKAQHGSRERRTGTG